MNPENLDDKEFGGFSPNNAPIEPEIENDEDFQEKPPEVPKFDPNTGTANAPTVASISDRLSNRETEEAEEDDGVKMQESKPFDVSSLSADDLASLKQLLNSTPDRLIRKKGNTTYTLRKYEDKLIIAFKKCYQKQVLNEELQKKEEVQMMPVKFYGADEYVDMRWDAFQNLERVTCECIDVKITPIEKFDGITISRETGQEVEMTKTDKKVVFTIKLPNGEKIDIDSSLVNA